MENMKKEHFLMNSKQQTLDFLESVKTKALEFIVQHDELLLIITLTLLFGCYVAVFFSDYLWKNRKLRKVFSRSMSIGVLHGGDLALTRLTDYHKAKANFLSLDSAETKLDALLNEERPNFKKLQRCVAKMEMSGKESQAMMKLEAAIKKAPPHEAYEFEMLLVETLIYQAEFTKALSYKCLEDNFITDARRPLYKAIIHISLGYDTAAEEEAVNCWKEFKQIRKGLIRPDKVKDTQLIHIATKFDKFRSVVISLKEDIQEVIKKPRKINK